MSLIRFAVSATALTALSLALLLSPSQGITGEGALAFDGHLVKVKEARSRESAMEELRRQGIRVRSWIAPLKLLVTDKAPAFESGSPFEYVEPNFIIHAFLGSSKKDIFDKEADLLWGMQAIHAPSAWRITTGSPNVVLAVSDTGQWPHSDLVANRWRNPGETGVDSAGRDKAKNGIDDDGNGFVDDTWGWNFEFNNNRPVDDHYHGTHVSGILGAVGDDGKGIAGVNWHTSIITLKFLGSDGSGTVEGAIRTILYAADQGAKALNCSWGSDEYSQALLEAIEYAETRGMLIIAAAGNDGKDAGKNPEYPAAYERENVISVAASNSGGNLAWFSNYGALTVDLAAPGQDIYSTFNPLYSQTKTALYSTLSGTSMAAPHVTGAVGLIYAANPGLNWREVKDILLSTVSETPKLQGKTLSGGILNLEAAVRKAKAKATSPGG